LIDDMLHRWRTYSDKIKELYDKESIELVNDAYQDAKILLTNNKRVMHKIIEEMMKKYTLYGKDVLQILEDDEFLNDENVE